MEPAIMTDQPLRKTWLTEQWGRFGLCCNGTEYNEQIAYRVIEHLAGLSNHNDRWNYHVILW